MLRGFGAAVAVVGACLCVGVGVGVAEAADADVREGEVIVGYEAGASAATREAARDAIDATVEERVALPNVQVVELPAGVDEAAAARRLDAQPGVRFAEPNYLWQPAARVPNDPLWPQLDGLARIDMPRAWDYLTGASGSAGVKVAVLDSGIAYEHADLAPNEWQNPGEVAGNGLDDDGNGYVDDRRGWDFAFDDADPRDDQGHGSHVSGIIAARGNNGYGVTGVNWDAQIMNLKVCRPDGCAVSDQVDAIAYASRMGAKVANLSLSGGGSASTAFQTALNANPNLLLVVAAGNGGSDGVGDNNDSVAQWPCDYTNANLICVGNADDADNVAGSSNFGATSVDLAAPGTTVLSTDAHTTRYSTSFETAAFFTQTWTTGGTNNRWTRSLEPGSGSGFQLVDSPGGCPTAPTTGCYSPNTDSWAQLVPISTSATSNCVIDYKLGARLGSGDFVDLELATAAGGPWTLLARYSGSTDYAGRHHVLGPEWSGLAGVSLRFHLTSDAVPGPNDDGVYIDDLSFVCEQYANPFVSLNGTSMASPHVAGVAALLYGMRPSATVAQVRSALLTSVDPVAAWAGKSVTGGRLNAFRALARFDTTPPDTTLTSTPPPAVTTATDATFTFTSPEPNTSFECVLDGADGAFTACASGQQYSGLGDGVHTFRVRAVDPGGNRDTEPVTVTWRVDLNPPDTVIDAGPESISATPVADFSFHATEPDTTSRCSLDGVDLGACSSPLRLGGLADGQHTLAVQATDAVGHVEPTPATYAWRVDLVAPETTLGPGGPSGIVSSRSAAFDFTASEPGTFLCRIDGAVAVACRPGQTFGGLGEGPHALVVQAVDLAGNSDASPAERTWTVDTTPPTVAITSGLAAVIAGHTTTIGFTANEEATFQCRVDGGAPSACSSPVTLVDLADGPHAFEVLATDRAGNAASAPMRLAFTVKPATAAGPGPVTPGQPLDNPPAPTVAPGVVRSPRQAVAALAAALRRGPSLVIDYRAARAGRLTVVITLAGRRTVVARAAWRFRAAGRRIVRVTLTAAGRRVLRASGVRRLLVRTAFARAGARPVVASQTVVLR
jgi:subtilisin family serine protease